MYEALNTETKAETIEHPKKRSSFMHNYYRMGLYMYENLTKLELTGRLLHGKLLHDEKECYDQFPLWSDFCKLYGPLR